MNPIDLLKLAEQAENEGRYAIADKLTSRAIKIAGPPVFTNLEAAQAALRGVGEGAARAGVQGAEKASEEAAAMYLGSTGRQIGHNAMPIMDAAATGGIHSPTIQTSKNVSQPVVNTLEQGGKIKGEYKPEELLLTDGTKIRPKDHTKEELEAFMSKIDPRHKNRLQQRINQKGTAVGKPKTRIEETTTLKGDTISSPTSTITQSGSPFNAGPRSRVYNVSEGSTLNMGNSTAAMLGGMGIVGALGALGMILGKDGIVRDKDNVVVAPQNIPADIARRLPRYQMMTKREQAGQIGGQRATDAQNFVDANASNPRLKNQRDWYNYALQTSGGDKNFANNVISYVKATPEMPSQIGGGPNI